MSSTPSESNQSATPTRQPTVYSNGTYLAGLGYWYDPDLGLEYVRARWLNNETGNWLSVDPVEGEPRYEYVGGQPTVYVDPSGSQLQLPGGSLPPAYQNPLFGAGPTGEYLEQRVKAEITGAINRIFGSKSPNAKIAEAIRRSLPMLPKEARKQVEALLSPATIVIISATLLAWLGAHFIGIGEYVDIVLLGAGFVALGMQVFDGARELLGFVTTAVNAETDEDLNRAALHFAAAVNILGIATVSAVLLRSNVRAVRARASARGGKIVQFHPRPDVGPVPAPGTRPTITRTLRLPAGEGFTDQWGNITVSRRGSLADKSIALYHELVHRFFTPRTGPLLRLRVEMNVTAYQRSAFIQYLEEALAEGFAQFRTHGFRQGVILEVRFPVANGYVSVSQLREEGTAIGSIVLGGSRFSVFFSSEKWETRSQR